MQLVQEIQTISQKGLSADDIRKETSSIYWKVIKQSRRIRTGNFQQLESSDLAHLFELYDDTFFDSKIGQTLKSLGHPLSFRLSGKMTRAGGKTTRQESWRGKKLLSRDYEIAISTTLLFQTFRNSSNSAIVTGVKCSDRLQALQRIFEHEMIHLIEMMVWYHSDCFRVRFKSIAGRMFQHTESTHQLTTVDERALAEFGIKVGDQVRFRFEGHDYVGFVNRITKRATVLVETPKGELFSDGKRYAKFYVPVSSLTPAKRIA